MGTVILIYTRPEDNLESFHLQPLDGNFAGLSYKFTRHIREIEEGAIEDLCQDIADDRESWYWCDGVADEAFELTGYWQGGEINAL